MTRSGAGTDLQRADGLFHRLRRAELSVNDTKLVELTSADQDAAFQRANRAVIGGNGISQRLPEAIDVLTQAGQPVIQLAAKVKDGARILR